MGKKKLTKEAKLIGERNRMQHKRKAGGTERKKLTREDRIDW